MKVHQWVPAAHKGDAIGDSARAVRGILRDLGHESELFALTIDDDLRNDVLAFSDPAARSADITILHYALPSEMTGALMSVDGGRVVQYHNITPAEFFAPFSPALFRLAHLGRRDLATLVGHVDLALGDSEYNRQELESIGFAPTGVFPIAVDLRRLTDAPPAPSLERVLDDGLTNFLFVGRIAPNKKIEDHIRLGEFYKRYIDTEYRFVFVGRTDVVPEYYAAMRALILEYQMPADRFLFTGPVSNADLATFYRTASAYVSLSEHEGFCVPLVEAMAMDVPVLAFDAGAVGETLGGSGILFSPKDLEYASEALGILAYDQRIRRQVLEGQRSRLAHFGRDTLSAAVTRMMETFAS